MKLLGRSLNPSYYIFWFLFLWGLLNIISAYYTGLANDEAYYWMFSKHLDWGYLDHPPMVAVIIWFGQLFFDNNLGVRFFNIVLNLASLYLLWDVCKSYGRDLLLFIALYVGIITFHVYSFIIVPDSPLLAACVLYLWVLQKYLKSDSVYNSILLVLAISFMIYSKYHGFLMLLFTIIALPKLLLKKSFWLICLGSTLLFLPHLIWEFNNDWPTYQYHFLGRGNLSYTFRFTSNYFLGLLMITGPLLGFILWYAFFKTRAENKWERVLKFNVLGFVLFFFLASFRSKIEPNWNSPVLIPLFILSYKYLAHQQKLKKWAISIGGVSLVLALFLRVYVANDSLYSKLSPSISLKNEFHYWKKWASEIKNISEGKPVVFIDTYQQASKYAYYIREPSYSYNSVYYRKNQYDLWNVENELQNKDVVVFTKRPRDDFQSIPTALGDYYFKEIDNYRSYSKVGIVLSDKNLELSLGENKLLTIELTNHFQFPVTFRENLELPTSIVISVFQHKKLIEQQQFPINELSGPLLPGKSMKDQLLFEAPDKPGDYYLFISLKSGSMDPGINSQKIELKINQ